MMMRSPQCLDRRALELVPDGLRQAGAGEEEHLEAAEEVSCAARRRRADRQQRLVALGHVEIDVGAISRRLRSVSSMPPRRRLALVDVERAAVVEHEAEVVVAAEGVVPRQPVDERPAAPRPRTASLAAIIAWLAHSMRCVLITRFGEPVEPEVNRNLAIVSGPTAACAASTAVRRLRAEQRREQRGLPVAGGLRA